MLSLPIPFTYQFLSPGPSYFLYESSKISIIILFSILKFNYKFLNIIMLDLRILICECL